MTRLVKRHLGGGWMAAIDAVGKIGSSVGDLIKQREHDKKQKEIAAMNMQLAQAEQLTAEWRAKAAMAAGLFDRNGESSVTAAINNGFRTMPYDNGPIIPGYQMAAMPQTNPSVVNSGTLSGVVSSFFKGNNGSSDDDDEDEAYSGRYWEDEAMYLRLKREREEKLKRESKDYSSAGNAVDLTLSGDILTGTEERPPITEKAQSSVETKPVGAGGNLGSDTEAAKHQKKKDNSSVKLQSAENGCRLKRRFNPREFKKKK